MLISYGSDETSKYKHLVPFQNDVNGKFWQAPK